MPAENGRFHTWHCRTHNDRVICDGRTGYEMRVSLAGSKEPEGRVAYRARVGRSMEPVPITTRDVRMYLAEIPELPLNPALQYLEVGPGLGGLAAHIGNDPRNPTGRRPIVIDPADYRSLQGMTEHALARAGEFGFDAGTADRLRILLGRCTTICDANRVRLINRTFSAAEQAYPALTGSADVVVELYSAGYYPEVEHGSEAPDIGRWSATLRTRYARLLRKEGTVYMPEYRRGVRNDATG